jgi:hypothetical protein
MKGLRVSTIGAAALLLAAGGTLAQSRVDQTQLMACPRSPRPISGPSRAGWSISSDARTC